MARQFVMSMYANKEDLYRAKAEYWECMLKRLCQLYFLDTQQTTVDAEEMLDFVLETLERSDYLDL